MLPATKNILGDGVEVVTAVLVAIIVVVTAREVVHRVICGVACIGIWVSSWCSKYIKNLFNEYIETSKTSINEKTSVKDKIGYDSDGAEKIRKKMKLVKKIKLV